MAQQTALSWFINTLPNRFKNAILNECGEEIEQAKMMEREQMIDAYNSGRWSLVPDPDGEEYYNRKYSQPK